MIVDGHVRLVSGVLEKKEGALFLKSGGEVLKLAAVNVSLPEGNWEMMVSAKVDVAKGGYVVSRLTPLNIAGTFVGHVSQIMGPIENRKFGGNYAIMWLKAQEMFDAFNNSSRYLSGAEFPLYLNLDGRGDNGALVPSIEITPEGMIVLRRKLCDIIRVMYPEAFTDACKFYPETQNAYGEAIKLLTYLSTTFPKTFKFYVQGGKVKSASPLEGNSSS